MEATAGTDALLEVATQGGGSLLLAYVVLELRAEVRSLRQDFKAFAGNVQSWTSKRS